MHLMLCRAQATVLHCIHLFVKAAAAAEVIVVETLPDAKMSGRKITDQQVLRV